MAKSGKKHLHSLLAGVLTLTCTPLNMKEETRICHPIPQEKLTYVLTEQEFGKLIQPGKQSCFMSGSYFSQKSPLKERIAFYHDWDEVNPASEPRVSLNFGKDASQIFFVDSEGNIDLYTRVR